MANEGGHVVRRYNASDVIFKCLIFVSLVNIQFGYSYPFFGGKRYLRTMPIRRSYISIPLSQLHNDYQLSDYDDAFVPAQSEYKFKPYEKYPFVQFFGYYPNRNYYQGMSQRRSSEGYDYFDDQPPQDDISDEINRSPKGEVYPYRQEIWYEDDASKFDSNSEANKVFLQNLILAQMYEDAKNEKAHAYDPSSDDYEDQHWFYGVPTTEVDEKEKVKQFFKNKEDENVLELESLARKKGKGKSLKEKDGFRKPKGFGVAEKPTKPKMKMTDDEYFDFQKQLIAKSRKKGYGFPMASGPSGNFAKKQIYDSADSKNNVWNFYNFWKHQADPSTKKLNVIDEDTRVSGFRDGNSNAETEAVTAAEEPLQPTRRPSAAGQKEVVLPRPFNFVRRPYNDVSSQSVRQSSVYDAIKRLLNTEKEPQKDEVSPQPQKRFVLSEDELTAELSGLKKKSA